ncbi:MAG TPA: polysaccharide biosynthesis tyrosine autokinase [Candidatus Koribacter sp.]
MDFKTQIVTPQHHRALGPVTGAAPGTVTGGDDSQIDLLWVWGVIARGKKILIGCVVFCLVLGGLYCALKTRRYEATADIAVNPESSDSLDLGGDNALSAMADDWNARLETQVRVLKSATLAETVIEELHLENNREFHLKEKKDKPTPENARREALRGIFAGSLSVHSVPHTHIIEIKFRNSDPQMAANVVNTLARDYQERNFVARFQATRKASTWLTQQLDELKANVEKAQQNLADYQKKTGIVGVDENNNLYMSKLDELSRQLTEAQADRIEKEAKYRIAKAGDPDQVSSISNDPHIITLKQQQADLKAQLADAVTHYGSKYPKVIQLRAQLDQVQHSISAELESMAGRYENDYLAARNTEDSLRTNVEKQKQETFNMSEGFNQYGILKREVDSGRDLYEDLLKKLQEAGVVAGLRSTNVDIIDGAKVPAFPVEPRVAMTAALSLGMGLFLGMFGVFINDRLDQRIGTPEDVEAASQLPMLTIIPELTGEGDLKQRKFRSREGSRTVALLSVEKPRSQFSESFRSLRTSIRLACAGAPPKVVVVTSSAPGEGKTTVSINTASVLAQENRRVLLVDADMRRGRLASILGLQTSEGLSDCLAGIQNWRDALTSMEALPNLHILGSGTRPPSPADLLDSQRMSKMMEEWCSEYDHIVLDTPPALMVTDALLFSAYANAVIIVARHRYTNRHAFRRVCELVNNSFPTVRGVVMNGFQASSYGYYSGYSAYGYGSGGGYESYYSDEKSSTALRS